MPYSEVAIVGYNANPPEDDGTAVSSNEVQWQKHLDKIGGPLKTALEDTQTAITAIITTLEGALKAPQGTLMLFQQTAAPTGWTKETTHDNKALRLVSGAAGSGGATAFTSVFASRNISEANMPTHTHSFSATTSSSGAHTHTADAAREQGEDTAGGGTNVASNAAVTTSSNGAHTHTVSGTSGAAGSGTGMDFAVQYVDVIIASKD